MTASVRWVEERRCFEVVAPADAADDAIREAWGAHERASVSEGACPRCRDRLLPHTSDEGPVQLCPVHGWWQIDRATGLFTWWACRSRNGRSVGPVGVVPA